MQRRHCLPSFVDSPSQFRRIPRLSRRQETVRHPLKRLFGPPTAEFGRKPLGGKLLEQLLTARALILPDDIGHQKAAGKDADTQPHTGRDIQTVRFHHCYAMRIGRIGLSVSDFGRFGPRRPMSSVMSAPSVSTPEARVLLVDDEPDLLAALVRNLRRFPFRVSTAVGGAKALDMLAAEGPFAVIVSDLHMPLMDGVTLLGKVRATAPDTVRILFTGQPDLEHAISAVNRGAIYRFLTKPCPPLLMATTIESAVEHHRLVTAERVLLEQTLRGSIQALTEILAVTSPMAFGRGERIRRVAVDLAALLKVEKPWQVEVAAMLSQVGCVILPPATIEHIYKGEPITEEEDQLIARTPGVVNQILASIPRLEGVREILRYQQKRFDGGGPPTDEFISGARIPIGARILRVVLDFDVLDRQKLDPGLTFDLLRGRKGSYDPEIVETLAGLQSAAHRYEVRELSLGMIRPGMTFAQDVFTDQGLLLVASGQEATPRLLERLVSFSKRRLATETLRVIVPEDYLVAPRT